MKLSLFDHKADNIPKVVERSWKDICRRAARPQTRVEKDGPLYSPATFSKPRRENQHVTELSMVVLEFDHNTTRDEIVSCVKPLEVAFILHSTHSHLRVTEKNPAAEARYRLMVPLSQPIPAAKFQALRMWLVEKTNNKADKAASALAQMYYTPVKASDDAEYDYHIEEGSLLDWSKLPLEPHKRKVDAPTVPQHSTPGPSIEYRREKALSAQNGNKIRDLQGGGTAGYPSLSEADLAYLSLMAFWSSGDPVVLDAMYRDSGRMREKWKRDDYRNETIAKALGSCSEFYDFSRNGNGNGNGLRPSVSSAPVNIESAEERTTDLGNARRLVRLHQNDLRYCHEFRKWFVYDTRRWLTDLTGEAERRGKATVKAIYGEAADAPDDQRRELVRHAIRSESESHLRAMLSLAQSEPGIPVQAEKMDADPMLLNCQNGTIDLRSGDLRKHQRADYITKVIKVGYDASALCPLWNDFLDRIMGGNSALVSFLQRAAGYSLTGDVSERVLFILYGVGANGKSVFVETLAALFGDYAMRTPTSTLMTKRDASIPNDVARLKGARFVHACETEEGKRLAESEIKDLTGGDTVSARYMRAEWFDFKPEFKLWLRTNHKPVVRGTDEAIWDRLKLIPFSVRIPKEQQDKALSKKLLGELPGILAWAVRGCLDWQRNGLGVPEEVTSATEGYRTEMDSFAGFIEECCLIGLDHWVASKSLRECYEAWGSDRGDRWLLGGRAFTDRLKAMDCVPQTANRVRGWRGIGLDETK